MSMPRWLRRLRARLRYRHVDRNLRQELDTHRAMSEDAFTADGASAADAHARAARALGNVTVAREEARGVWLAPWIERLQRDLRQAIRRLRRSPGFTVSAVAILALGVGANAVMFSVIDGVLLKPLPYVHAEQLVDVAQSAPDINLKDLEVEPAEYVLLRESSRTMQRVGLYHPTAVSVTGAGDPERVQAMTITSDVLPVLGVTPFLGHDFGPDDGAAGRPGTVIVTYGYWRDRLNADPHMVGRTLRIDGEPREIIGVLPRGFRFLDDDSPLFLPRWFDRQTTLGNFGYGMIGRLRPGVTAADVNAEIHDVLQRANQTFPPPPGVDAKILHQLRVEPDTRSLKRTVVGDIDGTLWPVFGATGLVLLIACANVASLLLVRAEGRRREVAVRTALGASAMDIAAATIVESLVIGLAAGAVGLALAYGADRALVAVAPASLPRLDDIGIDAVVVAFSIGIAILSSVLFSLMPIVKQVSGRINTGLRLAGRTASHARSQQRAQNALVTAQVALALVVLVASGLMVRTYRALTTTTSGFTDQPANIQTFRISISKDEANDPEQVAHLQRDLSDTLAAVPGVTSVGFTSTFPLSHDPRGSNPVFAQDRTYAEGEVPAVVCIQKLITPGYLGAIGIAFVAGRDITWSDVFDRHPVAIVSEGMARAYWPGASATTVLGKRIRAVPSNQWDDIIGVVADTHDDGMMKAAPLSVYYPPLANGLPALRDTAVAVSSTRAGSDAFVNDLRHAVWSVAPNLPVADVHTLDDFYRLSMAQTTLTLVMLLVAGGMGLLLGVIGLYGVIAYAVAQRTREVGIRLALGAEPTGVARLFVRQGLRLGIAGVAIGAVAAIVASRAMASLLFHVRPVDPATYIVVATGLLVVVALASYIPARRAMRVDPAVTLRQE